MGNESETEQPVYLGGAELANALVGFQDDLKTARITFVSVVGEGEICLFMGDVVSARFTEATGDEAVAAMLASPPGRTEIEDGFDVAATLDRAGTSTSLAELVDKWRRTAKVSILDVDDDIDLVVADEKPATTVDLVSEELLEAASPPVVLAPIVPAEPESAWLREGSDPMDEADDSTEPATERFHPRVVPDDGLNPFEFAMGMFDDEDAMAPAVAEAVPAGDVGAQGAEHAELGLAGFEEVEDDFPREEDMPSLESQPRSEPLAEVITAPSDPDEVVHAAPDREGLEGSFLPPPALSAGDWTPPCPETFGSGQEVHSWVEAERLSGILSFGAPEQLRLYLVNGRVLGVEALQEGKAVLGPVAAQLGARLMSGRPVRAFGYAPGVATAMAALATVSRASTADSLGLILCADVSSKAVCGAFPEKLAAIAVWTEHLRVVAWRIPGETWSCASGEQDLSDGLALLEQAWTQAGASARVQYLDPPDLRPLYASTLPE